MASCYYDYYNNYVCYNSGWYNWGRWLLLGLVIAAALVCFFFLSCLSARRRRHHGFAPYRGTGWTLNMTPAGHNPPTYYNRPQQETQQQQPYYAPNPDYNAPPAYGSQPPNTYPGLQHPEPAYGQYRTGESMYEPPKDPPPGRV